MKTKVQKTVYEISAGDLQEVAKEVLERKLTEDELTAVGNRVGDYIDWFQAIENAINDCIRRTGKESYHNPFASAQSAVGFSMLTSQKVIDQPSPRLRRGEMRSIAFHACDSL